MPPAHGRRDPIAHVYDAILVLSFGGPDGPDDVMPFLENVTRGRGIPRERLEEVAEHYLSFGGASPINAQNQALIEALRALLEREGPELPIYWGNRNWHPFVEDTMKQMRADGIRRAIAFATSGYSSYSACRQYREDILRAQNAAGDGAPIVDKIRHFFNHPGFIEPQADNVKEALRSFDADSRPLVRLVFTAHSIPIVMSENSSYVAQLEESCRLVAERVAHAGEWDLVYQSRSGPPHVPWLEPDVCHHLEALAEKDVSDVVVVPIGFVSDHLEVKYDLDTEAAAKAEELGIHLVRAASVGTHPDFVRMIRDLIVERIEAPAERVALGKLGASHDICANDCCAFPGMRPKPAA